MDPPPRRRNHALRRRGKVFNRSHAGQDPAPVVVSGLWPDKGNFREGQSSHRPDATARKEVQSGKCVVVLSL